MPEIEITEEMRIAALRAYLLSEQEIEPDAEIEVTRWDDSTFDVDGREWMVLDDGEANERAKNYIRESLWAFQSSFLTSYVPEGVTEDVLQIISEKCEDGNPSMLALVGDRFDELVEDAIQSDGRGHFLNTYDGEEREIQDAGVDWYVYRVN